MAGDTAFTFQDATGATKSARAGSTAQGHLAPAAALYDVNGAPLIGQKARADSVPITLSTEDVALLSALGSQTTLAAILAKLIAAPATEAKQDAIVTALGLLASASGQGTANSTLASIAALLTTQAGYLDGVESGQAAILAKLIAAPATEAKQDAIAALLTTQAGYLDNVETLLAAATPAGENHLGEVGGNSTAAALSFTVSTSPAYTTGDVVGGKITIANALRASGKAALVQDLYVFDAANQKMAGNLLFFNADPTAATITDNSAFAYGSDAAKQIGKIDILVSDWTTINGKATLHLKNLGALVRAASGTTIYAAFVTTSTPTFATSGDLAGALGLLRD